MSEKDLFKRVDDVIGKVRPILAADGGDVELIKVEGKKAYVKMKGACHGCPMSQMTLQYSIEKAVKDEVEEIEEVVNVDSIDDESA